MGDAREATLEDLAQQVQSLLDLQSGNRIAAEKDGQWTKVVRCSNKCHRGGVKAGHVIAVYEDGKPLSSYSNGCLAQRSQAQVLN